MRTTPAAVRLASLLSITFSTNMLPAAEPAQPAIEWRVSTPIPEPRDGYAAGVIDGKLVMIGGTYWEGSSGNWTKKIFSNATNSFDPLTQRWEKHADAPVKFSYAACAQVGDTIYVIGGMQNGAPSRDVHAVRKKGRDYAWKHHSQLPETRLFANAVAMGSRIYVVGGVREFEPFDAKGTCCTSKTAASTLWTLDTAAKSPAWKPLARYPGDARWLHTAVTDGNAIYVFGGTHIEAKDTPPRQFNDVLRYEPGSDRWSRVGDMPESLQVATPVNVRGQLVLVGMSQNVVRFDPAAGTFTPLASLPHPAMINHFVWMDPLLVGSSGESSEEGPRRRSERTFIGKVK